MRDSRHKCVYDLCVCVCEACTPFWDPILLSYTPSLTLQLPPPSHSPLSSDNRAAHITPSPNHATPPPPSPSFVKTISAGKRGKRGKREKVTNRALSNNSPFPPAVCVCAWISARVLLCIVSLTCGHAWFWCQNFSLINEHVGHEPVKNSEFSPSLIIWEVQLLSMTSIDLVHWS